MKKRSSITKHWSYKVWAVMIIVSFLGVKATPVQAASGSLPEQNTDLYVVYNYPDQKLITVEIREQQRLPDGSVSAMIAVRAETLIAYNLTFTENKTNGEYWEELDFLPLYPSHTYDIARITIKPGGYFTIQGTKFGMSQDVMYKMTLIQMCTLVMHLVGAKPPVDSVEFAQAVADSLSIIPNPVGAIGEAASTFIELTKEEPDAGKVFLFIAGVIEGSDELVKLVTEIINLMVKTGAQVSTSLVKGVLKALNVFEIIGNVKRAYDAYNQIQNLPDLVDATITLAPKVTSFPERYRVFELNEEYVTSLNFQNIGSEIWQKGDYELYVMDGIFPIAKAQLVNIVRSGQVASWNLAQKAPPIPGIYRLNYQLAWRGRPIGPPVPAEIVVVPENSDNLKSLINTWVEDAKNQAGKSLDDMRRELERRIEEALWAEVERRLREICGGTVGMIALVGGSAWSYQQRRRRHEQ